MQQYGEKRQKLIASFIIILAVVMVTAGVQALNEKSAASSAVSTTPETSQAATAITADATNSKGVKDGTYTASTNYQSPGGTEAISVNLTVSAGSVTAVSLQTKADNRESEEYHAAFKQSYQTFVVGKKLSDISLSRVSGASLTTEGFNEALQQIKNQAQSA